MHVQCSNCDKWSEIETGTLVTCECGTSLLSSNEIADVPLSSIEPVDPVNAAQMLSEEFDNAKRMSQFESVWKERLYAKRIKFIAIGASFLLIGLATYLGCAHFSFERQKRDDLAAQKFAEESRQLERSTQEQNQKDEAAEIAEMQRKKILIEAEQKAKFLIDKDRNERARVKQRDNAREALSIGILAAIEAKKKEDWKQVQTLLERVEALPDNSDHPSKIIATALLQEANQELENRSRFDAELVAVEDALRHNNYDDALKFCAQARAIVPQSTDLSRIAAYEKRVHDGLAEIARKNAVSERTLKFQEKLKNANKLVAAYLKNEATKSSVQDAIAQALAIKPNDAEALALVSKLVPPKTLSLDLDGGVKVELVLIPAGTFEMGSPATEKGRELNEKQHKVTISSSFYLGKHVVTQEQYEAVMKENPSLIKEANNPVQYVTWELATKFCEKLSQMVGRRVKLPTEAQWEYACRGGTKTPFYFGETIGTDKANYDGRFEYNGGVKSERRKGTLPVGSFEPNAFGLHDMHGNVSQWCRDAYSKAYETLPTIDPFCEHGVGHVLRGGAWSDPPEHCRSAYRIVSTVYHGSGCSFRILVEAPDGAEAAP